MLVVRRSLLWKHFCGNYTEGAHLLQSRTVFFSALVTIGYFLKGRAILRDADSIDFYLAHFFAWLHRGSLIANDRILRNLRVSLLRVPIVHYRS